MRKNIIWESVVRFAKKAINSLGWTWEEIAKRYPNVKLETIKAHVRKSYSRKGDWDNLNKKEKQNRLAKEMVKKVLPESVQKDPEEVLLCDTGYLMNVGISWIMEQTLDIYISKKTLRDFESLSRRYQICEDLATFCWSSRRITVIDLHKEEDLWEEPVTPPKKERTRNIVAVAVRLDADGKKVRLLTNSWAVASLAKHQDQTILYRSFKEVTSSNHS